MSAEWIGRDRLTLQELGQQSRALAATLARQSYAAAQHVPAHWLRHLVGSMLVELRQTLPDAGYLRHLEAAGFDLSTAERAAAKLGSYVEIDALLALMHAASDFYAEQPGPMGFRPRGGAGPADRAM